MTFGCASDATARASRSKRAVSASGASSLIATRRPSSRSSARHTSDMPPRPSSSLEPVAAGDDGLGHGLGYAPNVGDLLTLEQAQALVLARAQRAARRDACRSRTRRAASRRSRHARAVDLPPFASSAMDGYAVRAADLPGRCRSSSASPPAARPRVRSAPARRWRSRPAASCPTAPTPSSPSSMLSIMTTESRSADAVAAGRERASARRRRALRATSSWRPGVRLGAAQLGALAAAGVADVACARRPRVAVLATGTELARPGEPLGPGQIYESNGAHARGRARRRRRRDRACSRPVADDEAAHRAALERGLAADVLVTSGGVSVGPHDLVRTIEAELGVEEVFWRVAIRPGKPVSFGVRGETLVFGLPGNPVSSLVGCELFVKPALRALQGLRDPLPRARGRACSRRRCAGTRPRRVRARARSRLDQDGVVLEPLSGQESHMIVRAAAADALVHVPRGEGELAAGGRASRWLRLGLAARRALRPRPWYGAHAARVHRDELRVDDVPVRREEARVARLQLELLVLRRAEDATCRVAATIRCVSRGRRTSRTASRGGCSRPRGSSSMCENGAR